MPRNLNQKQLNSLKQKLFVVEANGASEKEFRA